MKKLRVAIVHEWFVDYSGSEKVVEQILNIYPDADLFAVIDFLPVSLRSFIRNKKVKTTFIQKMPFAKSKYRFYFPLMPFAIEQLDLSDYQLIISSSHAVAKGVLAHSEQLHICYCHSPVRYAWDLYFQYMKETNLRLSTPKGLLAKISLHYLRLWDLASANKVDYFVSNSDFVGRRIRRVYHRFSTTIYPPVDVKKFLPKFDKKDYYLTASRFVPYKRIDLIVDAFSRLHDKKLVVIGDGPEYKNITSKKYDNIEFLGYQEQSSLIEYMQNAKAFIFAAVEDFGITPVEAMACGTPVIAYKAGGAKETIIHKKTGIYFEEQTVESLIGALHEFENFLPGFDYMAIRNHAESFSHENFVINFEAFVNKAVSKFFN